MLPPIAEIIPAMSVASLSPQDERIQEGAAPDLRHGQKAVQQEAGIFFGKDTRFLLLCF